jgi:glycosyltransferase involved in cell wall biosynthesis
MKKLSIITCCYNKWNFTKSALTDLLKLPNDSTEIIVVDNSSSDETNSDMIDLSKVHSNIIYIRNEENFMHSTACNQGFKIATGDVILFLNNDIKIKSNHSNWTESLIDYCYSTNGLVGPTMGLLDSSYNFIKEANEQLFGNCYLSGWCIAATKDTWNKINNDGNIWEEKLFYFNDSDLAKKCKEKNISQTVIPIPELVHFGKISASQINVYKLYTEGRKKFLEKWSK